MGIEWPLGINSRRLARQLIVPEGRERPFGVPAQYHYLLASGAELATRGNGPLQTVRLTTDLDGVYCQGIKGLSATKILWGQIVFLIVLSMTWGATQWTAWQLGFQSRLGARWFDLAGMPIYYPPAFFWWWYFYGA